MSKRLGGATTIVDETLVFHPTNGYQLRRTWEGTHGAMLAEHAQAIIDGAQAEVGNKPGSAGLWMCTAFYSHAADGSEELPYEFWDFDMGAVQYSIWSHPTVDAGMTAFGNRANFRKLVEDSVSKGTALPDSLKNNAIAIALYYELTRGTESYENKTPTLMRQRSFTPAYVNRARMEAVESIYSTGTLVSLFGIPKHVGALLPVNPVTTPVGTTWGWKARRYSARLVRGSNKVEEVQDWTFAAWSTLLYTLR